MNKKVVFHIVGMNLTIIGLSMLIPAIWSFYYGTKDIYALLVSFLVTSGFGLLLFFYFKPGRKENEIHYKEGFAVVTFTWLLASLFGTLPFMLSGDILNFADAIFESTSGFTTTGSTILEDIEALQPGIMFWRSQTHWLGGMGILVLFIAILSITGSGGLQVYKAESTSLIDNKLRPKLSETAKILWFTYVMLTAFLVMLLLAGGMSFFDSLCHAFSTIATGGFSTKNLSIGFYDSSYIQWILTLFMFLSGINFALYYPVYKNKSFKSFYKNAEFKLYSLIVFLSIAFTFFALYRAFPENGFFDNILDSAFHVVSVITSTGFATTDYNLWPEVTKVLLFTIMFIGGCTGSTVGSIKVGRYLILFKQTSQEIKKILHPKAVTKTKIGDKVIEDKMILNILQFFFIFIFIFIISAIIISFQKIDFVTALTAAGASLTNVGPGLGMVGPMETYSHFNSFNKVYLSFLMLLGRLELYTVLVLLNPVFWKK
ncbi:MAG: TrkH family potassium uptake protein [Eubacteriales bacterium]|nr:TrkH family potassium uptake protein [Eubacteriales bacterium]